jgi:beta-lactamase regulating signal transducer with metallopeptidase domain
MNPIWLDGLALFLRPLLHATWQGGVLALVVLAATYCLGDRLRPNWRFALWLVVFARLATPWVPASPWSLYALVPHGEPQRDAKNPTVTEQRAGVAHLSQEADFSRDGDEAGGAQPGSAVKAALGIERVFSGDANPQTERSTGIYAGMLWRFLTLIWLAGVVVLATRMIRLHCRLAGLRASWTPAADPALAALFEQCRGEARGNQAIGLRVARKDIGPAACGAISPLIVLPERLLTSLDRSELRFVLLHELIHVRRHDALVDCAARCITCIHWLNPTVWLALAGLRRERELACDAALLDLLGTSARKEYGAVLLKAVEMLQMPAPATAGAVEAEVPVLRGCVKLAQVQGASE